MNGERKMLDMLVTSRVKRKLLVIFAKYPDLKTNVKALADLTNEDPGNIQKELQKLVKCNFLVTTKEGKIRKYHTNKQFPILKELQSIVIKSQQAKPSKPSKKIG